MIKAKLKHLLLGKRGVRPRHIRVGLLRGLRFNVDTSCKSMRLIGADEREIASSVRAFGRRARSAVDVGANDGWYAVYFASLRNIQSVVAFEPSPDLHAAFEANFALNDLSLREKTTLIPKFLGNRDEGNACTFDAACGRLPRPVVCKIDVDGGELSVLQGMTRALSCEAGQMLLVVETHSVELEESCILLLRKLGYSTRVIKNGWYRAILPETRPIPHNRWFIAEKPV